LAVKQKLTDRNVSIVIGKSQIEGGKKPAITLRGDFRDVEAGF